METKTTNEIAKCRACANGAQFDGLCFFCQSAVQEKCSHGHAGELHLPRLVPGGSPLAYLGFEISRGQLGEYFISYKGQCARIAKCLAEARDWVDSEMGVF